MSSSFHFQPRYFLISNSIYLILVDQEVSITEKRHPCRLLWLTRRSTFREKRHPCRLLWLTRRSALRRLLFLCSLNLFIHSAAFFILFPAATRAGIISSYFGSYFYGSHFFHFSPRIIIFRRCAHILHHLLFLL